ncbi:ubiquitin carboxyl-terminal hydrolase [Russula aff. rugulosa BPL654]|nr:ubiquitin carboxyl-terminal hydrolase [Russula aff. rugulosa BPL654]
MLDSRSYNYMTWIKSFWISSPSPSRQSFCFSPFVANSEELRKQEEAKSKEEGRVQVDHAVFWIEQTIRNAIMNACGTIGLLHTLTNISQLVFEPESPISNFIDACSENSPLERAQFLESTDLFTNIHAAAAASGQTVVPDNLDTDLHFTFATDERRLIELDGGRAGPVDRGKSTDLLKDVAWYVKEQIFPYAPAPEFSMIALLHRLDCNVVSTLLP